MPLPCFLRPVVACAAVLLPAALVSAADFQVITVRGTVTAVSGAWNPTVAAGTTFVLTTQVDLAAPDRDPSATGGKFETPAAPFSFLVGDYTFSTTGTTIEITNSATEDGYEFENDSRFTVNGFNNIKVKTRLESQQRRRCFSSTALPVQQFPVTSFDNKRTIEFRSDNGQLDGRIDSYSGDRPHADGPGHHASPHQSFHSRQGRGGRRPHDRRLRHPGRRHQARARARARAVPRRPHRQPAGQPDLPGLQFRRTTRGRQRRLAD